MENNSNYTVTIVSSSRELSAKERVSLKNSNGAIKLDEATKNGEVIISPVGYAVLGIHNEKSADKDYQQYVIFDKSGEKYITGSASFFDTFIGIYSELNGANGEQIEDYSIRVLRKPSKNYKGKEFITCDIL